jgi:eukaryotic-like serine/threonine-protein kinase
LRADDRALVDAAASVADGAPVDWAIAESKADAAHRRLVRHLRLVESIASLHRSIPIADPDLEDELKDGVVAPHADRALSGGAGEPHWGRLSLLDRIGHGTSCEVFRAWDVALHREVALKLLHDEGDHQEAHTRLLEEARRLARVRHTNVVQVYGAEQHDGRVGLWMELVRGESLEQIVQARGAFGGREAALIGLDLCAALAAVHAAGLLHRDIKAQNVMRESGGRLVLMDFGTGEELAGTNRLVGTPLYLAPEIFRGQRASVQSDLYSLGVLLYYLVTSKFPVNAGSMEQLAQAHGRRERRPLRDLRPDLPDAFIGTIERALDGDPARRYQSVGELESALRESLDAPTGRAATKSPDIVRRPRLGWAFLGAAAVLLALIAGLIVWTGRPGQNVASIQSLAVLPLVDRSGSLSPEMTDAMTEQLIATLGQIRSLRTTTLASSLSFKASDRPRDEIAKTLGVDAILEGNLGTDAAGGTLTLDAKLSAASGGATLWSGAFDRPRGDSKILLGKVATAIADAVEAPITSAERERLTQARSTSPAAEEAYLQGRLHFAGYGAEAAKRALDAFKRALKLDSSYGAAHAGSALSYLRLGDAGVLSLADARLSAVSEIRQAFDAGEDGAEVYAALAETKFLYDWDWDGAERDYRRSLELNPGLIYARSVYAQLLTARRRFESALKVSEETMRLDPQSTQALVNHGLLLYYSRNFDAARAVAADAIAQDPAAVGGHLLAARISEAQGKHADALTEVSRAVELTGDPAPNLRVMLIRAQAHAGHRDAANAGAEALRAEAARGTIRLRSRDRAYLELGLGRTDNALAAFADALGERDPSLLWVTVDPRVDVLRNDPRFQAIIKGLEID